LRCHVQRGDHLFQERSIPPTKSMLANYLAIWLVDVTLILNQKGGDVRVAATTHDVEGCRPILRI